FVDMGHRDGIHVVILAWEGKVFSAGHVLAAICSADEPTQHQIFATCAQVMLTIQSMAQPVIAKLHGLATAAGCQLAATCVLAVAATSARFATPGVRI